MIKVERLGRKYGDFTAVDNVSFTIEPGEIIGLLGHNGAGKTTIMKMLTGFLEPSTGFVSIDGLNLAEHRAEFQHKIGYLPENCPLYPEMTVIDFLNYSATLRGLDHQQSIAAVAKAINKTRLGSKASDTINTLSRGYRQRVGAAQAILSEPELLILDEPTNGLDPTQIQHMRALINQLAKTSTIIISTHILSEVQAICDRVLILRDAELVLDAKLDKLQHSCQLSLRCNCTPAPLLKLLGDYPTISNTTNKVSSEPGFEYLLTYHDDELFYKITPQLVRKLSQNNIDIYTIKPIQYDLETVFQKINAMPTQTIGENNHAA